MASERVLHVKLLNQILWIVLDHPDLFEHHLLFFFNFFRLEPGPIEQIREQLQRCLQLLIQHLHIKGRRFSGGERIHLTPQRIDLTGNLRRRAAARSLEEHMLQEVRQPLFPRLLIARSDVDPYADRDGLQRREQFGHNAQPVVENDLAIHNRLSRGRWFGGRRTSRCRHGFLPA